MNDARPLPRTTHFLKPDQRTRLMRSTRKVEHLLGETPLFVEPSTPRSSVFPAPAPRQAAYIYVATPRSSSLGVYAPPGSQASSSSSSSHASTSRPVLAVSAPDPRYPSEPPLSPGALSFPTQLPSPADEQRREQRRKMARVVRTLGENVPAALVFPKSSKSSSKSSPPATPTYARARRNSNSSQSRRSARLVRAPSESGARGGGLARVPSAAARAGLTDVLQWDGERPGAVVEEESEGEGEGDASASRPSDVDSTSMYSTLSGGDWQHIAGPPPGLGYGPPPASAVGYDRDRGTHRTEKGWSGEWVSAAGGVQGMQSMDEVAARLRGLRLK